MRRLKGGKPRRFKDHRRTEAKRWEQDYGTVAERFPPRDRLGREVVALAADMLADYRAMRLAKRGTASARRKTAGLLLGALRVAADGANGHEPLDLARAIQQAQAATDDV
jgi:hypothetical protein